MNLGQKSGALRAARDTTRICLSLSGCSPQGSAVPGGRVHDGDWPDKSSLALQRAADQDRDQAKQGVQFGTDFLTIIPIAIFPPPRAPVMDILEIEAQRSPSCGGLVSFCSEWSSFRSATGSVDWSEPATKASSCVWLAGRLWSSTVSNKPKITEWAPIPSTTERMTMKAPPGFFTSLRMTEPKFCQSFCISSPSPPSSKLKHIAAPGLSCGKRPNF
jgi:hypothetical protein